LCESFLRNRFHKQEGSSKVQTGLVSKAFQNCIEKPVYRNLYQRDNWRRLDIADPESLLDEVFENGAEERLGRGVEKAVARRWQREDDFSQSQVEEAVQEKELQDLGESSLRPLARGAR
jgi:hypothetical protein